MEKRPSIDQVFNALGDPTRRRLLKRVSRGPISVSRLAEPMEMSLVAVFQHVQVLEEAGLVRTEKSGRVRICTIEPTGLAMAADWIAARRSMWQKGLDRLGELLNEEEE